jgi:hypothetical protein
LFKLGKGQTDISFDRINELSGELSTIRAEIDEQLTAINGNTNELEIQNSFICEIDNRINKVEEKIDGVCMLLKQILAKAKLSVELSKDEQRAFLVMYTHEKFMTSDLLSQKSLLTPAVVEEALSSMLDKGIPVEREILDGKVYFRLNKDFKLRQAKEQIIKIDPDVTGQYQNTLLQHFFAD